MARTGRATRRLHLDTTISLCKCVIEVALHWSSRHSTMRVVFMEDKEWDAFWAFCDEMRTLLYNQLIWAERRQYLQAWIGPLKKGEAICLCISAALLFAGIANWAVLFLLVPGTAASILRTLIDLEGKKADATLSEAKVRTLYLEAKRLHENYKAGNIDIHRLNEFRNHSVSERKGMCGRQSDDWEPSSKLSQRISKEVQRKLPLSLLQPNRG